MDAAPQVLTGEDGDNPPHFAVSQVAAGLGHSHVGPQDKYPHKKVGSKSTFLPSGLGASARSQQQQQQQEPEARTAFKRALRPPLAP